MLSLSIGLSVGRLTEALQESALASVMISLLLKELHLCISEIPIENVIILSSIITNFKRMTEKQF